MQPIIKDIILSISDDVVSNLTQSFEKTYYGKMNYSSKNTILDSDNKLLKETIVELIKNSYDADAYGVKIILDKPNTPQSRIVLIDTGTGMTQSDFENKWMVIGTNNKITEPYTPKGRKKAGKKGIGRFSVERLAEKVQIYSFPEFEPPYRVDINWNSFEEINIPALTQRIGILKDHQESTAAKFICNQLEYFMVTDKILQEDKDTVESILGTKSFEYPMFYKNETLRLLEDKVVPIIKKYEDIELLIGDVSSSLDTIDSQSESEVFTMLEELYIKFNLSKSQTGMILIMEGLRDEWKQRDIDKLQKELRLLVAPDFIESDPFKIELVAPEFKVEDIVLVNEILDLRYAKIDAEIFDNAQKSRIIYSDKEGKNDIVEENYEKPLLCGNLKAEIYFFLRDSANLSDAESGYNFRFAQRILDTYCGIKIYRDNFRVKPYGDIGNDWLLLDQKKVKDTHGYLVGNNQVIGVVKIGDETNPLLIDATNREGIIENEAYSQLVSFLSKCTNLISDVRRKAYLAEQEEIQKLADEKKKIDSQFENLKELYKEDDFVKQIGKLSSNDEEVSAQKIDELLETYIAHTEKKKQGIEKIQNDYNRHYSETQKAYQAKIDFQESELNLYKNLASLGMLTGSFGHTKLLDPCTDDIFSGINPAIIGGKKENHYKYIAKNDRGTFYINTFKLNSRTQIRFRKARENHENSLHTINTLIDEILLKFQYNAELHDLKDLIYQLDNLRHLKQQELGKLPKDEMFEKAEEYLNDKGIENSLVFEEYNMDFKMKFNGSTYYCELLVDNSLEEKTEYRKNISVEKLTTWFEKLNSNFGILFYYPRINRMYFYPVSNNMTLPEITDGKKIRQIKINDKCLL